MTLYFCFFFEFPPPLNKMDLYKKKQIILSWTQLFLKTCATNDTLERQHWSGTEMECMHPVVARVCRKRRGFCRICTLNCRMKPNCILLLCTSTIWLIFLKNVFNFLFNQRLFIKREFSLKQFSQELEQPWKMCIQLGSKTYHRNIQNQVLCVS